MKGLGLKLSPNKQDILVILEPLLLDSEVEAISINQAFNLSEYSGFYLDEQAVFLACDRLKGVQGNNSEQEVIVSIAHVKDAEVEISISGDKMAAEICITSPFMGKVPTLDDLYTELKEFEVVRGISKKRLVKLLEKVNTAKGGEIFKETIAKGLPPKSGRESYIRELVPNALERMLTPKLTDDEKVNMRDFGEIICVKANQEIAQRMPPTSGRAGYTVMGNSLQPDSGKWKKIILGENVYLDENNENIVLAQADGLPKVAGSLVYIDNVFQTKGVNVATGNINFDGSIVVNGDITEKMQVVAKGDITVNGFIESAHVEAGGDIIVTQGASGKLQTLDCTFIAGGNIYIGHAQGISIKVNNDLIIDKQLAYSKVISKGNITIGKVRNPLGKLFASKLICYKTIRAGHVGAVSGSSLIIDYSEFYNQLIETHEKLTEQLEALSTTNANHEITISNIKNRKPSPHLNEKLFVVNQELEEERAFLNWLRISVEESKERLINFNKEAKVIANKALHHGVSIKLNDKNWQAKEEFGKCKVFLENRKWVYEPIIL